VRGSRGDPAYTTNRGNDWKGNLGTIKDSPIDISISLGGAGWSWYAQNGQASHGRRKLIRTIEKERAHWQTRVTDYGEKCREERSAIRETSREEKGQR